jgi:transposase
MIMTLHPHDMSHIPENTVQVARNSFPKGNIYMKMRDEIGVLYKDEDFATLYRADCGQNGISAGQLALVTVMQFVEGLTDRQAADAVRGHIDWKYALSLELNDPGFDYSVLSEFRKRLIDAGRERELLNQMLASFQELGLLKSKGRARTDSTHVIAAVRHLNRLELVGETLRHTLNDLAYFAASWLKSQVEADWFERYGLRFEQYRLPKSKAERERLRLKIGIDGHHLLEALYRDSSLNWLLEIPSVETLRIVWLQQYYIQSEQVYWREQDNLPPNKLQIESPYDVDARNSSKREMNWTGYSMHLTETCDPTLPNLIINVETSVATSADVEMTPVIHARLDQNNLLPEEHFVDTGYVNAQNLVDSKLNFNVDLVGKVPPGTSWQLTAQSGFEQNCFTIDWDLKRVDCPMGKQSKFWRETVDNNNNPLIKVEFDSKDCGICSSRSQCTRAKKLPRRLTLKPQELHLALHDARIRQESESFKLDYKTRAGVEGSIAQATGRYQLRRCRYIGLAKTLLQHVITAAAINLSRMWDWWQGVPRSQTRVSRFAQLAPTAS